MSMRNIGTVYRKEMIDSLRDRRTLVSMVVIPVLLMPLMTIGIGAMSLRLLRRAQKETPRVMILGGSDSPRVMRLLVVMPGIEFAPPSGDYAQMITNKELRAAVRLPAGFDDAIARGEPARVDILYYEGDIKS